VAKVNRKIFLSGRNADTPLSAENDSSLASYLRSTGVTTEEIDKEQPPIFAVLDLNRDAIRELKKSRIPKSAAVLLRFEPEVVCPENYRRNYVKLFGKVIDFGRVKHDTTRTIAWPQSWRISEESSNTLRETKSGKSTVMINANKLSLIRGELYSLRREVIHKENIDVFGPGWDSSTIRRIRILVGESLILARNLSPLSFSSLKFWFRNLPQSMGVAKNKIETLSQYKCALVIENSRDYMSEKLLDALLAGCIPVYVGPSCSEFGIPKNLVIECEPEYSSVSAGIDRALALDHDGWMKLRNDYVFSAEAREQWSSDSVFRSVSSEITGE